MNTVYIIIDRSKRVYEKGRRLAYGKLSHFLDTEVENKEVSNEIKTTFSKRGLNKDKFINSDWEIQKVEVIRKEKLN